MKNKLITILLLISVLYADAQNESKSSLIINEEVFIKWDNTHALPYLKFYDGNFSFSDFQKTAPDQFSFLCNLLHEIRIFSGGVLTQTIKTGNSGDVLISESDLHLNAKIFRVAANSYRFDIYKNEHLLSSRLYSYEKKLGAVRFMGICKGMAVLDVETLISENPLNVKREVQFIDVNQSTSASHTLEIPLIYYTYTHNDLKIINDTVYYALSAPEGLKIFSIVPVKKPEDQAIKYKLPHINYNNTYHFNENLLTNTEHEVPINDKKPVKNNPIYRSQIIAIAKTYQTHEWVAGASNIGYVNYLCGTSLVTTPEWVQLGLNTSIPYMWGGFSSLQQYEQGLIDGKSAGDKNTTSVGASCAVGVDCSGYVSRAWGQTSKYGTSTLPNISTALPSFDDLLPGDILNHAGSHVRLVYTLNGNGTITVLEATGSGWIVKYNTYTYTALQPNYIPRYYNNVLTDTLYPPELISPEHLATAVNTPVNFEWTTLDSNTVYLLHIAQPTETWSADIGFTASNNPSVGVPVVANITGTGTYTWLPASTGAYEGPKPNTTYQWTVRAYIPGQGYSVFSQPRFFTTSTDTVMPTTDFLSPNWVTGDYVQSFTDTDNILLKYRFYHVADNNSGLWQSNRQAGFLYETFEDDTLNDWIINGGNWGVVNNTLYQSDSSLSNNNCYILVNTDSAHVYVFEWRMKITGPGTNKRGGIYFFCDAPSLTQRGNAYMVYFRTSDNKCQIYKSVNDAIELKTNDECIVGDDEWYNYKVIYNPQTGEIIVFKDNIKVSEWVDPEPLKTGIAVSLRTGNASIYYDDFKIWQSRQDTVLVTTAFTGLLRYENCNSTTPAGMMSSLVYDYGYNFSAASFHFLNVDFTAPTPVNYVWDGLTNDTDTIYINSEISANWVAATDTNSDIAYYKYAIATLAFGNNIVDWQTNSMDTVMTHQGLNLDNDTIYYVSVVAVNGAGLESAATSSNGQLYSNASFFHNDTHAQHINLYPNPAQDKLNFMFSGYKNVRISMFLIFPDGKRLALLNKYLIQDNNCFLSVPVTHFARGVYILQLTSEKGVVCKKIILY